MQKIELKIKNMSKRNIKRQIANQAALYKQRAKNSKKESSEKQENENLPNKSSSDAEDFVEFSENIVDSINEKKSNIVLKTKKLVSPN